MIEYYDAGAHLDWIRKQLEKAEKENYLIWIMGHIPPGDFGCLAKWSIRLNALIERYQHIIRFNAFGHDHRELFEVTRGLTNNKPISVNYVSGSLGTYMGVNPSVRIYTMHAQYHIPLSFKIYEFDLDIANSGNPVFREYTDFMHEFKMKSLSPTEHAIVAEKVYDSEKEAVKFVRF